MKNVKMLTLYFVLSVIAVISLAVAVFISNVNNRQEVFAETSGELVLVTTSAAATQNSEFSTNVYIDENSNVAGFTFTLNFDSSIVTIVKDKCVNGSSGATINVTDSGVTVSYASVYSTNSRLDLVTLVFKVNENTASGTYNSWLNLDSEGFYDAALNDLTVNYTASALTVSSANIGDVYEDGEINSKDVIYLLQYLANIVDAENINLVNANAYVEDNSDDGTIKVNSRDSIILLQYLAKMDVTIGVGEWTVKTTPTATTAGTLVRKTAAGIETVTLPVLNNTDYTCTVKTQATCVSYGVCEYTYTYNGVNYTFEAAGTTLGEHVSSDWTIAQAATCESDGYNHKVCTVCGAELETETVAATGHNYGEWTVSVEPTLTSTGTLVKICANNSSHKQTASLPALNQTDYVYTLVAEATCATEGKITYSYNKDGQDFVFSVAIEKLAHTEVADAAVSVTCTTSGLSAGSHCSVCGQIIVEQTVIPATGHIPVVTKEGVSATCSSSGLTEEIKCSVCGYIIQEQTAIAALSHTDSDHDYICDTCGELTPDESEYTKISTVNGLKSIIGDMSGLYMLTANIDISGSNWSPIGSSSVPFTGLFNGNGYKIMGLTFSDSSSSSQTEYALFIKNSGTIANVELTDITVTINNCNDYIAGLVVYNSGIITNCKISGTNKMTINQEYSETLAYSSSDNTSKTYTNYLGGICVNNNKTIQDCTISDSFTINVTVYGYYYHSNAALILYPTISGAMTFTEQLYFGCVAAINNGKISGCRVSATSTVNATVKSYARYCTTAVYFKTWCASIASVNNGTISDTAAKTLVHKISMSADMDSGYSYAYRTIYNSSVYDGLIGDDSDNVSQSKITFLD